MLALAPFFLTLAMTPIGPTVRSANFTEAIQWELVAASPRIVSVGVRQDTATGTTIGQRDGIAYVLTADHGVPGTDERELHYFTKESYPVPARKITGAVVALRLSDPDIAILKVPVGNEILPVVKLAAPGARPKKYPVPVLSIGCDDTRAPFCITRRRGSSSKHAFGLSLTGQRGWNAQPLGGSIGLGTSPVSRIRSRRALGSMRGTADSRAWV